MIKKFIASLLLSFYYFFTNGLLNHAASLSFFFILSFVPTILFIVYASSLIIINNPQLYTQFLEIIKEINSFVWEKILSGQFKIETLNYSDLKFIGALTLLFSSTFFIRAVIRGFDQIFNRPCYKNVILSYFVPILINLASVVIIIIFVVLNLIVKVLEKYAGIDFIKEYTSVLDLVKFLTSTPMLLLFLIALFFYKFFPGKKLSWKLSILISFFFSVCTWIIKSFAKNLINTDNLNAYGSASVLLISLVGLYFLFIIFLFWAQFAYVFDNLKLLTIRFFIDSNRKLWFRDFVVDIVKSFAKNHILFYSQNETFTIDNKLYDNIFVVAEGKITVCNQIFTDSKNMFFIPNEIIKYNTETKVEVLEKTIILNMPLEMYYTLLDESSTLKKLTVEYLKG